MRRMLLVVMVAVVVLSAATASLAQPATDKDDVRLRIFVHYPREPGKPQPPQPVCNSTTTDPATYGVTGWHLAGSTEYRVNYVSIPSSVADPATAIHNSFSAWNTLKAGNPDMIEGAPTTVKSARRDGQNIVAWGNVQYGNAIAVTYVWSSTNGEVVEVDCIMSSRLPWHYTDPTKPRIDPDQVCGDFCCYDVQDILTHEVGPWVGLDDRYSSADKDLTMYGYGAKGELKKDTLASGDTLGVAFIY